jgi:hypothetical protein
MFGGLKLGSVADAMIEAKNYFCITKSREARLGGVLVSYEG